MLSAIAFLSSYLIIIQFQPGIFKSFASCNIFDNVFLLIYFSVTLNWITKICLLKVQYFENTTDLVMLLFALHIHHHHLKHLTCSIAGFLHQCIYTLQHIPEDDFAKFLPCLYRESTFNIAFALQCMPYGTS